MPARVQVYSVVAHIFFFFFFFFFGGGGLSFEVF